VTETILEARKLTKSFGAVTASNGLSFSVRRGEIHALIGPNGAGKTTVVNQLGGELRPDAGTIIFDGEDITRLKAHQRAARGLARSFQITSIFENMTVAENMALSIIAHNGPNFRFWRRALDLPLVRRQLPQALARVDLANQAEINAGHLSHGEKRQLEVGMALTGRPKLLMLDEPMAGQGPGGTVELSKLIESLRGSVSVLLVEHDMEAVFALADRITVLVYGCCIATGTPAEIRRHPEVREAYLGEDQPC